MARIAQVSISMITNCYNADRNRLVDDKNPVMFPIGRRVILKIRNMYNEIDMKKANYERMAKLPTMDGCVYHQMNHIHTPGCPKGT